MPTHSLMPRPSTTTLCLPSTTLARIRPSSDTQSKPFRTRTEFVTVKVMRKRRAGRTVTYSTISLWSEDPTSTPDPNFRVRYKIRYYYPFDSISFNNFSLIVHMESYPSGASSASPPSLTLLIHPFLLFK